MTNINGLVYRHFGIDTNVSSGNLVGGKVELGFENLLIGSCSTTSTSGSSEFTTEGSRSQRESNKCERKHCKREKEKNGGETGSERLGECEAGGVRTSFKVILFKGNRVVMIGETTF